MIRPIVTSQSVERAILLSASLPQHNRGHKKKPSLHVSNAALRIALEETQREEGMLAFPHRVVFHEISQVSFDDRFAVAN